MKSILCLCYVLIIFNGFGIIISEELSDEFGIFEDDPFFNAPEPLQNETGPSINRYRFGVISDLDKSSAEYITNKKNKLEATKLVYAYLKEGDLVLERDENFDGGYKVYIEWDEDRIHRVPYEYKSGLTIKGRGMELSTLNMFNGKLYSGDDRTGIIYELPLSESLVIYPIPWVILPNGDGKHGDLDDFKIEWSVVKNDHLWVGSHGITHDKKYIKRVSPKGEVTHHDWSFAYEKMDEEIGIHEPGYVIHEAAEWSPIYQKWVFMPRKISPEEFHEDVDPYLGNNTIIMANERFDNIEVKRIGEVTPSRGFSDCKFIPDTNEHLIIALKSVEIEDFTETYITAFDIFTGKVLLPETKFADQKYEGIEFL